MALVVDTKYAIRGGFFLLASFFIAADETHNARVHLFWIIRLRQVIVRTDLKAHDAIAHVASSRADDDRNVVFLADLLADFKSVHPRKRKIQNQQIVVFDPSANAQIRVFKVCNLDVKFSQIFG